MNKTSIEWVKNPDGSQGYTSNPITGCLNGCVYCYARRLANTRLKDSYLANKNVAPDILSNRVPLSIPDNRAWLDPFYPRFWPEKVEALLRGNKQKGIFLCNMGEMFGDWIPWLWQDAIFHAIKCRPQHRFYLLTKQPQNLQMWSPFPENCWVGVTATNDEQFVRAIGNLKQINATVKFISFEPLLNHIRMRSDYLGNPLLQIGIGDNPKFKAIDWLIIGAQTKPYLPPKIEWVQEIVSAADKAGIPVFLKNNLYMIKPKRQEMPKITYTKAVLELE